MRALAVALLLLSVSCGRSGEPATSPAPGGAPAALVAIDADGRVLVLSSSDGAQTRVLAVGAAADERTGIALSADGRTTFFVRPLSGGEREIASIPTGGGDPDGLIKGFSPAPHPDGRLAYISGEDPVRPRRIGFRDLVTGEERSWRLDDRPQSDRTAALRSLSWSADGRRLAFVLVTGGRGEIRLLDPASDGSLWDAPVVHAGEWVDFRGALGTLAVITSSPWRLVDVPPGGGAAAPLADLGGPAGPVASDRTGKHLLYVRAGTLHRLDGGTPRALAGGIVYADW